MNCCCVDSTAAPLSRVRGMFQSRGTGYTSGDTYSGLSSVHRVILLLSCLLFGTPLAAEPVRIAVLAIRGDEDARQRWAPSVDYLTRRIDGYEFVLIPHDLDSIAGAVRQGEVDFVLTNPGNYVELEARFGASRLATLKNRFSGVEHTRFGAVVFTGRERDDLQTLEDLRGTRFAAVDRQAFGGYQMAVGELRRRDVDPEVDFARLEFTGFPQELVVRRVLSGAVDAGTVRTEVLESMAADGRIELNAIKVLGRREVRGFDLLLSTPLYPEWAFARLRDTPDALAEQVAASLILMPSAQATGWTAPLDYNPVHELFRTLHIGPYSETRGEALQRLFRVNGDLLLVAGLALVILLAVTLAIFRANRRLAHSRSLLRQEVAERERTEVELERHRDQLEARVAQRTEQLHQLNQELERDVVQRVQAQRALSRSRTLLKDLHDSFARVDADHEDRVQGLLRITRAHFECQAVALVHVNGKRIEPLFEQQVVEPCWRRCIVDQVLRFTERRSPGQDQAPDRAADQNGNRPGELPGNQPADPCHVRLLWVPVAAEGCWVLAFATDREHGELHGDDEIFSVITLLAGSEMDRHHAELDLDQHRTRLAAVSRLSVLGQMTTELAHELNQPLTGATNFATGCLRRLRQPRPVLDQIEQGLERTVEAVERAAAIVRSLRERVRQGECCVERVDLCKAVRTTVRLINPQAEARGVEISSHLNARPIWVDASAIQLEQLLVNLLGNAIEASTQDGERRVQLRCSLDGKQVMVAVADRGQGFSPRQAVRLFEPFYSTKESGMGVGLGICRTIVETYGGSIEAHARNGGGALFVVRLPLMESEQTQMQSPRQAQSPSRRLLAYRPIVENAD